MGNGTTIGWIGCRMMETAVCVLGGRGCASFFMEASGEAGHKAMQVSEQTLCRLHGGLVLLAAAPLLSGCIEAPLSTLAPASEVSRSVATLWWTMAGGTGVVLSLMVVLAALALRRNPPHAPGRRGMCALLIGGGLMLPTVVILSLLAYGLKLDEAQWPAITRAEAAQAFRVDVIAHRWWWEVRYPGLEADRPVPPAPAPLIPSHEVPVGGENGQAPRTVNVVHVPAGVPIHVRLMSSDVIHGFWVPRVSGKLDAVPGRVNRLRMVVDEPGQYAGACAEFCGEGHAQMHFTLVAHSAEDMEQVLASLREASQ